MFSVKVEPEYSVPLKNEEIANDSSYPKHALDLSTKNEKSGENQEIPCDMQPEFINIKMEVDINTAVKQEPQSPVSAKVNSIIDWHQPQPIGTNESVNYTSNGRTFEIEIKQEPVEAENMCSPSSLERSKQIEPNDDEVSEDLLCLNAVPDGKYMCPVCQRRFATKSNVQRHQLLHSKDKLECTICFRSFVKPGHLKKHIQAHSSVKAYDCSECGKKFRTTSNLEQHKKTHLTVKPFPCEVCHRQFAVKANLVKHQGKSRCKRPSDQPITCHVCDKVFKKEFLLRSHLRRHTTEKPYSCETCKMSFKYKSTLIRHIQLHNGVKPYSCKICLKTFTHAGLIKPHMRKHTGEKPYTCPVCNKLFAHKHNMERHSLRHAKVKHLDCHICHKKFPKESRLRYHLRIHTYEKPFACKLCPKRFSHKQNVIRHYGRKHPGEVFDCVETDASVARDVWDSVVQKKIEFKVEPVDLVPPDSADSNEEYVIP